MSIRWYYCDTCKLEFTLLVFMEYHTIQCVYCGSKKISRIRKGGEKEDVY